VNKERIEKARLKNKDEIQIGKYKFIFITGP
jgi:pSer/pThr/pTyr-binding forkhead associated (FHA) protein